MRKPAYFLLGLLAAFVGANLAWRWASRYIQLPCPACLAWLLENPVMQIIAGPEVTLDRIGLQPGEHGLDVGSGPGRLAIPAAQRVGSAGQITALDIQPRMLARLEQRARAANLTNITTRLDDITTGAGLTPASFDRAWLVTVLGEIPDRAAALRQIYRLLKPGGSLSITEIMGDPHYQRREVVLKLGQEAGFEPARHWQSTWAFTQNFVKPGK